MVDSGTITCDEHGPRHITFVCQHLVRGTGVGFYEPNRVPVFGDEADESCAWCSECELVRQRCGGWNDESESFARITLICDVCFAVARERNLLTK